MGKISCVIFVVCWSTYYYLLSLLCFLQWWSCVTLIWLIMVQKLLRYYYFAAIQFACWSNLFSWSKFPLPGRFPGGQLLLEWNFSLWQSPGKILPLGLNLTHYWDASCPGRCPGIGWYFCTYDDTELISLYAKVCVRYGIFLYIRPQYVSIDPPNISMGELFQFEMTRIIISDYPNLKDNDNQLWKLVDLKY